MDATPGDRSEREAIVAWLNHRGIAPASIHPLRDRLMLAWWAFKSPGLVFMCTRIAAARAIERGDHLPTAEAG